MDNPVSCHLITWGNDLTRGLAEAAELGYTAVETFTHSALEYEGRPQEFVELLGRHGFRLSALYAGGHFSDPSRAETVIEENVRVARFLAAIGTDRIVFGPGGPRESGGTSASALRQAASVINEAARRCLELGVRACVHPHIGTEIQNRDEVDAILELTDPEAVWFCPDTAHLTEAGMDAAEVIRTYASRVAYVHLKDLSPSSGDVKDFPILAGNEALPIFCELGLGVIDFGPIVAAITETGYHGWLTIEIDQSTSTPSRSLATCRDFAIERLGLALQHPAQP